jgi:hypothetical protein
MSNTFSLDDIRAAAEAKYGSTDFELSDGSWCKLLNPLRLSKANREKLIAQQERLNEDDADTEVLLSETLLLVAADAKYAKQLIKELGGDLAMLATIFEKYNQGAQVGEASPSQD